ncbi:DUF3304 domain-containing protein [Cupriavidus gilardii]|uniref:DUF3304 domain-containing protein n=1 Tax=Cupriavidus gilardii TaxID=82541 RepID=UPI0020C64E1A|nr:DUF3304 domain-containing protein [Cupriavidus gilardii]
MEQVDVYSALVFINVARRSSKNRSVRRVAKVVVFAISMWMLSACESEVVGTNIVGYNHTDKDIGHFTVDGKGGTYLGAHEGGGGFVCCVAVPESWRPDLAVKIGWTNEHDKNYRERVVPVPRYDEVGHFAVHFLRNGEIKVFVTMYAFWSPHYPLKGSDAQLRHGIDPSGPGGKER